MVHHSSGLVDLPPLRHIRADLEDASEQSRKEDGEKPLDRTRVSEHQGLHGGLSQTGNPPLSNRTLHFSGYKR